jgi:hypothetical protein
MNWVNLGIVKNALSKKLESKFLNEGDTSVSPVSDFISILKESKLLTLENTVYSNIENKVVKNEALIQKYIDDNFKPFSKYHKNQILEEHDKLKTFIDEDALRISKEKKNLYEAINNVILEYANSDELPDVDAIHDSYSVIYEHLKNNKEIKEEESFGLQVEGFDNEKIVRIALDKFNQKYKNLSESEKDILKTLVFSDENKKKELFESLKSDTIDKLNKLDLNEFEGQQDVVVKSLELAESMEYSKDTLVENMVKLTNLKAIL